ncbi:MAG: hydrogenase 4 subunit B [Desulfuromonadaceae bacterium]|nr:hydrogenase 4 subunit B [Desulfuromonadaceae bacterium]
MYLQLAHFGVLLALLAAAVSLPIRSISAGARMAFTLLGLSGLVTAVSGCMGMLTGCSLNLILPIGLPWLNSHQHLDPLAGFFLIIVGGVTAIVSLFGPSYIIGSVSDSAAARTLAFFTGLFVAGMYLVILAADAFSFMVAWELMSVASYFLVAHEHHKKENVAAAFIYLLMAQAGGLFILLGYGVLAGFGTGFTFADMQAATLPEHWQHIAFALAFIGFGMKAGIVPLHVWLPQAHPVAPSHISALMSGVMLKVAVYGFIRFCYGLLGTFYWQWGVIILLVGCASALLGILYALMQQDLKRLLAYSSVENIGIIYMGLGLSVLFASNGNPVLAALGLVAALYHCVNHALFKSLLFLGAGALINQSGQHDLNRMGGLMRLMPITAICFLVGCISISALPPFNGFVSEWLTFQTALQGTVLDSGVTKSIIAVAAASLALTGALAAACFVKVFGIAFLGQARHQDTLQAHEVSFGMRASQILLASGCLLLGIFPSAAINSMQTIPTDLLGIGLSQVEAGGWLWLTPISARASSYGAPLVLFGISIAWAGAYLLLHPRRRKTPVRYSPRWDCGFGSLSTRNQYTATSFSQPIRRIFRPVWPIDERIDPPTPAAEGGRYSVHVGDWAWEKLYLPLGRMVQRSAKMVTKIQGGNIRTYLAYSFFTLIIMLWIVI